MILSEIPGAFHLPRLNWDAVRRWVETNTPESGRFEAWNKIVVEWLGTLDDALGNRYRSVQRGNLILFFPRDNDQAQALFEFAEAGLAEIKRSLGELVGEAWLGPLVILLFGDVESYCHYVSPFDPIAESIRSAGVCFQHGYVHVAIRPNRIDSLQRTMLHEITHACLSHLRLPAWLEEGISQLAEEAALPHWARFTLDSETATEIRQFWKEKGLSEFWFGTGFHALDETQQQSYRLAQIFFRLMTEDRRKKLPEFVRNADRDDAGDSAARKFLGIDVAELAGQFLGKGDWIPVPPDYQTYVQRGIFYAGRKEYDRAIADFDQAIQLDESKSEAYIERGLVYHELENYAAEKQEYERCLAVNQKDYLAYNNFAWLLATCPDDEFRVGERAVELATKACEITGYSIWYSLGTLGAAYAECGDFDEAMRWAEESMGLAPETELASCEERLRLYENKEAYRDHQKLVTRNW